MNSELGGNGKNTVVLDWFRPPESKTLRPVWRDYVEEVNSPRMELSVVLYVRRARVSIRGRWTLIGVGYRFKKVAFCDYREDPTILWSTGRSGPLVRDLQDPFRWGPMGTHVSQEPLGCRKTR
jgi:hypothetical protein